MKTLSVNCRTLTPFSLTPFSGGVVVAQVKSRDPEATWQLLTSFIGYVERHFRGQVASINLQFDDVETL